MGAGITQEEMKSELAKMLKDAGYPSCSKWKEALSAEESAARANADPEQRADQFKEILDKQELLKKCERLQLMQEDIDDFQKMDTNGDGMFDEEELKAWESGRFHTEEAMRKIFELADVDKDMHITKEELEQAREAIAGSDAADRLIEWS